MTEAEWLVATDPEPMLGHVARAVSDRRWRLFACACCWRHPSVRRGKANTRVLKASEAFADGLITQAEMEKEHRTWFTFDYPFPIGGTWQSALAIATTSYLMSRADASADHLAKAKPDPLREKKFQADLLRCIFGHPFRPVACAPSWRSETAVALAAGIYEERAFDRLPVLADALEEAGCDHADVLSHCRGHGPHARGCWVVDGVLGKG